MDRFWQHALLVLLGPDTGALDLFEAHLDDGLIAGAVPPTVYFPMRNFLAMIGVIVIGEDRRETRMSGRITN
jgi:hypothetical protein